MVRRVRLLPDKLAAVDEQGVHDGNVVHSVELIDQWPYDGDVHPRGLELVQRVGVIDAVDDFTTDAVDVLIDREVFVGIGRVGVVGGPAGVWRVEAILVRVLFFVVGVASLEQMRGLFGGSVGADGPRETTVEDGFLAIDIAVGGVRCVRGHDAAVGFR